MLDYGDLLQRAERAKDLLIECSLQLSRAARLTFGLAFLSPGHWYARKARRLYSDATLELERVRSFVRDLPEPDVPSATAMLGEELAWWLNLRPAGASRLAIPVSARWEWNVLSPFDSPSLTFEQRMQTARLEVDNLLDAVATLSAKLRLHVLARATT